MKLWQTLRAADPTTPRGRVDIHVLQRDVLHFTLFERVDLTTVELAVVYNSLAV